MSWFDAHAAYVIEVVARERVADLRAETEHATAPSSALPAARPAEPTPIVLCCHALAKASR
jgi:hypothetical protein